MAAPVPEIMDTSGSIGFLKLPTIYIPNMNDNPEMMKYWEGTCSDGSILEEANFSHWIAGQPKSFSCICARTQYEIFLGIPKILLQNCLLILSH
jgi:hypothetical protein